MNWLRTLLLTTVATLAVAGPGCLASPAAACDAQAAQCQMHYYLVYYRTCPQQPWAYYGYTPDPNIAAYYVQWFQSSGYQAFYR